MKLLHYSHFFGDNLEIKLQYLVSYDRLPVARRNSAVGLLTKKQKDFEMTNLNKKMVASATSEAKGVLTSTKINKTFDEEDDRSLREGLALCVARKAIKAAQESSQTETYEAMLKAVKKKIFETEKDATMLKELCCWFSVDPYGIPAYVLTRCWKDGKIKYPVRIMCGKEYSVVLKNGYLRPRKITKSMLKKTIRIEDDMIKMQDNNSTEDMKGDI
ncbi:MAG: hypothetical protein IJV75_04970 [Alphaproteobacteria bacterium]|nr:hypothetical protein [Alphaproteobacteria bacterium]